MGTAGKLRRLISHVFDAVLESPCLLCDRSTPDECCVDCWRQIQHCQLPPSQVCKSVQLSSSAAPGAFDTSPLLTWGAYQGSLKRALAKLKYDQGEALGRLMGQALGQSWLQARLPAAQAQDGAIAVVPIPLHADKQAQRGYNQTELIAAGFCDITRLRLHPQVLIRTRATDAQFGLSAAQREKNVAGAFRVNRTSLVRSLQGRSVQGRSRQPKVILVDDIYTTGATIRAATAALRQEQISVIGIAAVARPFQS